MAVTKSWTAPGMAPAVVATETDSRPRGELVWLVGASFFVAAGLAMVFAAKTTSFAGADRLINANTVTGTEQLLPLLESFPDRTERAIAAQKTYEFLESARPLQNIGALSRLR